MDIEALKFSYAEKTKELQSLTVNVFTLNPRVAELTKELEDLRKQIEAVEGKEEQ